VFNVFESITFGRISPIFIISVIDFKGIVPLADVS